MAGEENSVEIVGLALEPVGAGKHAGDRGHRRVLVGLDLDAYAQIPLRRQQVHDDVEALSARRPVHAAKIDDVDELRPLRRIQRRDDEFCTFRVCKKPLNPNPDSSPARVCILYGKSACKTTKLE